MHRVVILGGGFGGLYAAKALRNAPVEITLVDRRNFHLFQPLLYQVATGSLSPGEIAAPLRAVLSKQENVTVLMDEAVSLNVAARRLILKTTELSYDSLIVATGSRNFYFGHDEWQAIAPGLKSIEDATAMRHKILESFEAAERELDPDVRRAWLTFAVVGGGPTGVELAGALAEIANQTLRKDFRSIRPEQSRILLLDGGPRLLANYPEDLSRAAERSLIRLGVRTRCGVRVTSINPQGLTMQTPEGEQLLEARTVLWAAGVTASPFGRIIANETGVQLTRNGQVLVSPDFTIPGYPEIFIIGDLAHVEQDGRPVPGVAPAAMQGGRYAAETIRARLEGKSLSPFRYFNKGNLAVIGRASAVADFGNLHLHGFLAWLTWLFVHLMYIVQFQSRVLVFIQWGFQYLTFSRGARLITGSDSKAGPLSGE